MLQVHKYNFSGAASMLFITLFLNAGCTLDQTMTVALWGDNFYSKDLTRKAEMIEQTVESMNSQKPDFTIFVGDTKNGKSPCTDHVIGQDVITIFNRLDAPTLYTLGDNEWTDCHRTSNGSYNPLERLEFLRHTFFNKATSQGRKPIALQRQGALGQAFSENSRFVLNNVLFVALHIPGSNNNLVASDKQCSKKSGRTHADCDAATAEFRLRNEKNMVWLTNSFAKARAANISGIVIAIQADIYFPFELSDGGYQADFLPSLNAENGYSDFFHTLVIETHAFAGQVLLVHGDSHYFKVDKAMFDTDGHLTENFTRVEVFGSKESDWVEMTVDPKSKEMFSFKAIMVPRS